MDMDLRTFVIMLSETQKVWNVEGIIFLGVSLDRYLHFLICFLPSFIFYRKSYFKTLMIVMCGLILFKEVLDLYVIWFFAKIPAASLMDTAVDLSLGFGGLILGYFTRRKCSF